MRLCGRETGTGFEKGDAIKREALGFFLSLAPWREGMMGVVREGQEGGKN